MDIILASASPRRRELLTQAGIRFEVCPGMVEEKMTDDTPELMVQSLARQKAEDVFDNYETYSGKKAPRHMLVIGADTIVVYEGKRLGKPADQKQAMEMLRMLNGQKHSVYTGVCMIYMDGQERKTELFFERTDVSMYQSDESVLRRYIATGEPMDKAGAYGIQGLGAILVQGISGDYNNVVGLPLAKVWRRLEKLGESRP